MSNAPRLKHKRIKVIGVMRPKWQCAFIRALAWPIKAHIAVRIFIACMRLKMIAGGKPYTMPLRERIAFSFTATRNIINQKQNGATA